MAKTARDILTDCKKQLFALTGSWYEVYAVPNREAFAPSRTLNPTDPEETHFFRDAMHVVQTAYGFTYDQMMTKTRVRPIPEARGMVFYLLTTRRWALKAIGAALGGYDHSTVIHGRENHLIWASNNSAYRMKWADVKDGLDAKGWKYCVDTDGNEGFIFTGIRPEELGVITAETA